MPDAILNPRRVPRAPARCEARCLLPGGGFWASDTTDLGPNGCQLQAPGPFQKGDPIKIVLTSERLAGQLATTGRVAWASAKAPWRIGVAFDTPFLGNTSQWFDELVEAYPGLATFRLAPDSLELTSTLWLAAPPPIAPELSADEVAVLRAVGAGATVAVLRERLGADWPALHGLLFTLIGRKLLTLDAAGASAPQAWAAWLDR